MRKSRTITVSQIEPGEGGKDSDLRIKVESEAPDRVAADVINEGKVENGKATIEINAMDMNGTASITVWIEDVELADDRNKSKPKTYSVEVKAAELADLEFLDGKYPPVSFAERVVANYDRPKLQVTYEVGKNIRGLANRICEQRESSFGGLLSKPMTVVISQPSNPKLALRLDDGKPLFYGGVTPNYTVTLNKSFLVQVKKFLKSDKTEESTIENHFVGYLRNSLVFRTKSGNFFTGYSPENNVVINESFKTAGGSYSIDWKPTGGVADIPLRIIQDEMKGSDFQQLVLAGEIGEGPKMIEFGKYRWPKKNYLAKQAGSFSATMRTARDTCVHYSLTTSYTEAADNKPSRGTLTVGVHLLKVSENMDDIQFKALQNNVEAAKTDLVGEYEAAVKSKKVTEAQIKKWAVRIGFGLQDDTVKAIVLNFNNDVNGTSSWATPNLQALTEAKLKDEYRPSLKFAVEFEKVLLLQRMFEGSNDELTARICRVATYVEDQNKPDEKIYVYVPLVELATEKPK